MVRGGYPGRRKKALGSKVPFLKPTLDWDMIRPLKARCEAACPLFNHYDGGCSKHLTPGVDVCDRLTVMGGAL